MIVSLSRFSEWQRRLPGPCSSEVSPVESHTHVVKTMKKRNIRKRAVHEIDDDEGEGSCFIQFAKKSSPMGSSKLYFSTWSKDKESKKVGFEYESCKEIQVEYDSKATATLQTETEISRDTRKEGLKGDNKVYKGICNYTDYRAGFRREQTRPLRGSAHIRVSARYDYQPDICKDYKETGYCGYGDSCKFMHDRGDYKSGCQIDKEWEARKQTNLALVGQGVNDDEEDEDEDGKNSAPMACQICKQPFVVNAMVTKCQHYFCEYCALKVSQKRCFVCDQPTQGTFNVAHHIRKMI